MLMRLYFTEFLLAFCAVHLVHVARDYLAEKIAAYRQQRMPAATVSSEMLVRGAKGSDWYVFFHRTDLVGEDCRQKTPRSPDKRGGAKRPRTFAPKRTRDGRATAHPGLRIVCS
jgi:hypothetical protein